jgi:hypothetical protein
MLSPHASNLCSEHVCVQAMVPPNTPIACIQRILGLGALAPRPHTKHTTRHKFGYVNSQTAIKPPACISWKCSSLCAHPHARRSLPSPTSNGSGVGALAPRSHTTHTTRHKFGYANSHTTTKPPACISRRCPSICAHPHAACISWHSQQACLLLVGKRLSVCVW